MFIIYRITNSINNKVYVGQTIQLLKERFRQHKMLRPGCAKLTAAMKKYGINNFQIEVLTIIHTQGCADYWETYFINQYNTIRNGYNIKPGGNNLKHSTETKEKISKSLEIHSFFTINNPNTKLKGQILLDFIEDYNNFQHQYHSRSKINDKSNNKYGVVPYLVEKYKLNRTTVQRAIKQFIKGTK